MPHYKKISEETLHQNPWWRYKHDTYALPSGVTGDFYYGETNGMVIVVPTLASGQVVLVNQDRYLADRVSTEFPAGGIKDGQDALAAAVDELREETGYSADDFVSVGEFEPDNGMLRDKAHVFLAEVSASRAPQPDITEEIEVVLRYPDEIEDMIARGDIWDGQTLAAWCLVRKRLLESDVEVS